MLTNIKFITITFIAILSNFLMLLASSFSLKRCAVCISFTTVLFCLYFNFGCKLNSLYDHDTTPRYSLQFSIFLNGLNKLKFRKITLLWVKLYIQMITPQILIFAMLSKYLFLALDLSLFYGFSYYKYLLILTIASSIQI